MKTQVVAGSLSLMLMMGGCGGNKDDDGPPLAPEQYRRPDHYELTSYKYSLDELKDRFSDEMIELAEQHVRMVDETNREGKWKPTRESIDSHQAPEWFSDAKFGMFIDWGLWSIAGWAPIVTHGNRITDEPRTYPDWYEYRIDTDSAFMKYHAKNWGADFERDDFIPLFKATNYQPEQLVHTAREAGMRYIVPFCKHHSGFCLWPSSFTRRDAGDMGPERDLIRPLVESCRKEGLKFGFYFSAEEWEYPVIGEDGSLQVRRWGNKTEPYTPGLEKKASGKIPVRNLATEYVIPQATEFIDLYDPDLIWYDADWVITPEAIGTYVIAAYFYNKAEGRKEVAVNDRYGMEDGEWLRGNRGDFYTDESGDMVKELDWNHPWEECRGISISYGFNWQDTDDNVISSKEFIDTFVDIVARGGNLLLITNLDGQGGLPEVQENRLKDIGTWLKVNGEGIYETRPFYPYVDGNIAFTRSKDNRYVYVILKEWPGDELHLKGVQPAAGSRIEMLGSEINLEWIKAGEEINVKIPDDLQAETSRPCKYAWVLKLVNKDQR